MNGDVKNQITILLKELEQGNDETQGKIITLLYKELHKIARSLLNSENNSITIQATELINEAYLRLFGQNELNWQNRKHFLSSAAIVMRRFLVDHARKKMAKRRIPQGVQLTYDDVFENFIDTEVDIVKLDEALSELEALDKKQANIVGLRFFVGLTDQEIAELYGVSRAKINLEWQTARLWLLNEMQY